MHRFFSINIASALAFILIGFLSGSALTTWGAYRHVPLHISPDPLPDNASVQILGIRNGALMGSTIGPVRISAGEKNIAIDASGAFVIKDSTVLTNQISIVLPTGMKFVASKIGKKYYPVSSAQGQNIKLENRRYFPSAEAAEAAGYKR